MTKQRGETYGEARDRMIGILRGMAKSGPLPIRVWAAIQLVRFELSKLRMEKAQREFLSDFIGWRP